METGSITVDGNKVGIITASLEGEDPSYPEMPFYESEGYPNSADFDRNVRLGHKHGYYPKSGSGGGNEGYVSSGDDPEFTARVDRMIETAKKEGITIGRGGGFRTRAQQERLYHEKPGLAAPPGHSLHELGLARDLTYGPGGSEWAHKHAGEFGLRFPMSYEPWHVQPVEGRGLLKKTPPPAGSVRGSWFSDPHTASGKSAATTPGIALPSSAGLGKMYEVTGPDGKKMLLPQIDVGPARWTGRGVDFSKPAAQQLGYDPTGKHFTVKEATDVEKMQTSRATDVQSTSTGSGKPLPLNLKNQRPLEELGGKAAGGVAYPMAKGRDVGASGLTFHPEEEGKGLPTIKYNPIYPESYIIKSTLPHEMGHAGASIVASELKKAYPSAYAIGRTDVGGFEELRQRVRDTLYMPSISDRRDARSFRDQLARDLAQMTHDEDYPGSPMTAPELIQMALGANQLADKLAKEAMNPPMPKPRPE